MRLHIMNISVTRKITSRPVLGPRHISCYFLGIAGCSESAVTWWGPLFLFTTPKWGWAVSSSLLRRERGLRRPPCGGLKMGNCGVWHAAPPPHHKTPRELWRLIFQVELPRTFLSPCMARIVPRPLWCSRKRETAPTTQRWFHPPG